MEERLKSQLRGHWELQHSHQRLEPESDNGANTQVFCGRTACSLFFFCSFESKSAIYLRRLEGLEF